jgi:hypothetical protein
MKQLLLLATLLTVLPVSGQVTHTVQSSCVAADSVRAKYMKDAQRLALRRTLADALPYKDSIRIDKVLAGNYLRYLLAVHNATSLPGRDTVVALKIHTDPVPEMNVFTVKAPASLYWMQKLMNFQLPTGYPSIDYRINDYKLSEISYYQSVNYDVVVFRADSNFNLNKLCADFAAVSGVLGSEPVQGADDSQNITAIPGSGYMDLVYTHGWQDCTNGCDYKIHWKFRVYESCVVEYMGWTGNSLDTGIPALLGVTAPTLYPNPFSDALMLWNPGASRCTVEVLSLAGELLGTQEVTEKSAMVNMNGFAKGMYIVRILTGEGTQNLRVIRQ